MTRLHWFCTPLLALSLGCVLAKPDPESDALARRVVGLIESGDSAALATALDPSLTTSTAWENIRILRDTLMHFHRDSIALVGSNVYQSPDEFSATITYEMHGDGWALVTVPVVRRQAGLVVSGVQFERESVSLSDANAFRVSGQDWRHYLVLVLAVVSLAICLGTSLVMLLSPMPKRFRWALLALLGIGQFTMNWSTGEVSSTLLRVQLLGAGYFRPGFVGPWLVSFSLPLGAVMALLHRSKALAAPHHADATPPPDSPAAGSGDAANAG